MTFIGGLTGMAVGSFLGVMIDRSGWEVSQTSHSGKFAKLRDLVKDRSRCGSCLRQLAWWENVPILSFIFLRGRCRSCRSPIPYWLVGIEIAGALAGVWLAYMASQTITVINFITIIKVIGAVAIATALVWIFFSDLVLGLVPDWAVAIGAFGAILSNLSSLSNLSYLGAAFGAALFFWLLAAATRGRGMGTGDITLAFFLGLWLGWPQIAVGIWLGFLIGAIVGLGLILLGRKKFGQTVPFGPFLIAGGIIAKIWGSNLLQLFLTI